MRWYERHVDAGLERWSLGALSPAQASRLLKHAHACARCGSLYERWAQAHRALEGGNLDHPSSLEKQALTDGGLAAALAAAAPEESAARWPSLALLGAALAAVVLAVVFVPPQDEFRARGEGTPPPGVALRVFCASAGQALKELHSGDGCRAGATLAFAAGGKTPYTHVAVQVRGAQPGELLAGPFPLPGDADHEGPLELTVPLPESAGRVEVTAAFSNRPAAALAALREQKTEGVVVLRQAVRVEEAP